MLAEISDDDGDSGDDDKNERKTVILKNMSKISLEQQLLQLTVRDLCME